MTTPQPPAPTEELETTAEIRAAYRKAANDAERFNTTVRITPDWLRAFLNDFDKLLARPDGEAQTLAEVIKEKDARICRLSAEGLAEDYHELRSDISELEALALSGDDGSALFQRAADWLTGISKMKGRIEQGVKDHAELALARRSKNE